MKPEDFPFIDEHLIECLRQQYELTPSLLEASEPDRLRYLGAIELIDKLEKIHIKQRGA